MKNELEKLCSRVVEVVLNGRGHNTGELSKVANYDFKSIPVLKTIPEIPNKLMNCQQSNFYSY